MSARERAAGAGDYAALLWDNDDVLVDTERLYFAATREVFAERGIALTPQHYFDYFLSRASGTSQFASAQGMRADDVDVVQRLRNARYQALLEGEAITIAGVREALVALRPHFVMGIVTSSRRSHFESMHRRTGLLEFFDFAVTREDYARSKPAPDPYLEGIARSGVGADRCLAIEDAPRGLVAARAAALDCWVIPSEFTRPAAFEGAARIVDRIADVPALLLDSARAPRAP